MKMRTVSKEVKTSKNNRLWIQEYKVWDTKGILFRN